MWKYKFLLKMVELIIETFYTLAVRNEIRTL